MAYSFKSSISFGLVYIPVKLTAAAKSRDIGFNMLEKKTGKRVRFKRVADGTDREVSLSDTVKGPRSLCPFKSNKLLLTVIDC